jgi:hypothetical protein
MMGIITHAASFVVGFCGGVLLVDWLEERW